MARKLKELNFMKYRLPEIKILGVHKAYQNTVL